MAEHGERRPVYCPHCGTKGHLPAKLSNDMVKCPACAKVFTVPSDALPQAAPKKAAAPAEVEFKKITVTYESGDPEEIEVRDEKVRNRGRTREINLKGGNRAIKKVLMSYKAEKTDNAKDSDRDALIILLGHK